MYRSSQVTSNASVAAFKKEMKHITRHSLALFTPFAETVKSAQKVSTTGLK